MADIQIDGEVIGIAMNGLGFGTDDHLWGGEFFVANFLEAKRIEHLEYLPMPGGAKAIREPWRMAAVYLHRTFRRRLSKTESSISDGARSKVVDHAQTNGPHGTNSPETSSMGRLFDAVSSLLRLRDTTNYEGHAAIGLEQIADRNCQENHQFGVTDDGSTILAQKVIRQGVEDILSGFPPRTVSAKSHLARFVRDPLLVVNTEGVRQFQPRVSPWERSASLINRNPERVAVDAINQMAHYLGMGIFRLVTGLPPDVIVVVGAVTRLWSQIGPVIIETVKSHSFTHADTRIVATDPLGQPRLLGTIALVLQKHFGAPLVA